MGAYHTGIQIFNIEVSFGKDIGVFEVHPKTANAHKFNT